MEEAGTSSITPGTNFFYNSICGTPGASAGVLRRLGVPRFGEVRRGSAGEVRRFAVLRLSWKERATLRRVNRARFKLQYSELYFHLNRAPVHLLRVDAITLM